MACANVKAELQEKAKVQQSRADGAQSIIDSATFNFNAEVAFIADATVCKDTLVSAGVVTAVTDVVDAFIQPHEVARDAFAASISANTVIRNESQALADNLNAAADLLV